MRRSMSSSIGDTELRSLPTFVTRTPMIVRAPPMGEPAVASCTLYAGRKPPSAIFITRACASVVDARGSFFPSA